jgi:uncharacterized protein YoxC
VVDPLFWLGLSILLVAVSLTAVLVAALPALQELARAARSAEKLFDTLRRELPPTLEAIRLTGLEISDLTDDVSQGVQSAGQVVKQVDQSITGVKQQAQRVNSTTRSVLVGIKAAWRSFTRPQRSSMARRSNDRYFPTTKPGLDTSARLERPSLEANPTSPLSSLSEASKRQEWDADTETTERYEAPLRSTAYDLEDEIYGDGEGLAQGSTVHPQEND